MNKLKWIKDRSKFLNESEAHLKDDTLHILADHDQNQSPELQNVLDKLDHVDTKGKVVTRFAPSPTGFLHIGGVRTALYNYLFAKQHDGIFYVRIEDTDSKRFVGEAEEYIKNSLEWCGMEADYAPWKTGPAPYDKMRQSERDYSKETKILLDKGFAYYAFDTEEELTAARNKYLTPDGKNSTFAYGAKTRMEMRNSLSLSKEEVDDLLSKKVPYTIRFKTEPGRTVVVTDIIRGEVSMNTDQTDDKVLVKSNGIPTYHMANVCDDHNMGTTHVIRGEEWLPSTPLHYMLYEAFGWTAPQFAHLPLILNPDGKGKLSKRKALSMGIPAFPMGGEGVDDKGKTVKYLGFKDEGFEADAVVNFLAMIGWTPKDNKELLSMADLISEFKLGDVHKAGARYDIDKAKYFNTKHLTSNRSFDELSQHVDFGNTFNYSDEQKEKIIELARKRSTFAKDMQVVVNIFKDKFELTDKEKSGITQNFKTVMEDFVDTNKTIEDWNHETIKKLITDLSDQNGIKMGSIMPNLRMVLTHNVPGPDLMTTAEILGREETIRRINQAL